MPSTYTTNLGIEKIASGDQSGTWGITTNTNFDLIDQAINGVAQITLASAGTSGSPNVIPITDGTVSTGRNKFIEFVDGGDLGATAYVQLTPNDAEKIVFMRNSLSGSRSVLVFQGTYSASNDFEIPAGKDVVLKFDGAGGSATVTPVFVDLLAQGADITTLSIGGTAVTSTAAELNILDGVTATTAELNYVDGVTSNIQTQLDAKAPIASPTFTGTATIPSLILNTGATVVAILDEDNMASNSATALATQQSIKAYVDSSTAASGFTVVTTNTTAVAGSQIIANSASALTVTLPALPSAGDSVTISNQGTATVTVGRNGENIKSDASDGTLAAGNSTQIVYVNSTIGWGEL